MQRAHSTKIAAVRRYLAHKFPDWTLQEHQEAATELEVFTLTAGPTSQTFKVKVMRGFLDEHEPVHIEQALEMRQLGEFLKVSGFWPILVTAQGLQSLR
jgi:hypothetical protein